MITTQNCFPCVYLTERFWELYSVFLGAEKGPWERGLFRKVLLLEVLEVLEKPQTVENNVESDHFLEILENLDILGLLENPPVKRPLL